MTWPFWVTWWSSCPVGFGGKKCTTGYRHVAFYPLRNISRCVTRWCYLFFILETLLNGNYIFLTHTLGNIANIWITRDGNSCTKHHADLIKGMYSILPLNAEFFHPKESFSFCVKHPPPGFVPALSGKSPFILGTALAAQHGISLNICWSQRARKTHLRIKFY